MNSLQRFVALLLGELAELNPLREITFNRLHAARERCAIHVVQHDGKARGSGHLRNTVAHCACTKHTNAPDWASRKLIVLFVRVSAQRDLAKGSRTARWIRNQATNWLGGLPGSTNSYANSYTIRATENANRFSYDRACNRIRTASGSDRIIRS